MLRIASIGALAFNMAAGFIGGTEIFRHPEWALLFGAEGAIIFAVGYALTRTTEA